MDEKTYRNELRNPAVAEQGTGSSNHALTVVGREKVQITGVIAVESFDDEEAHIETELGLLTIRGEELQIKQLDLESGRFEVEGYVNSLQYASPRQRNNRQPRSRGFLDRLLR